MKNWRAWLLPVALVAGGFIIGSIVFFPINEVARSLIARSTGRSGLQIEMGPLRLTTGLSLGLSKGSLFGFRVRNLRVTLPQGGNLRCEEAVLAPRIWPLLLGQVQAGLACRGKNLGEIKTLVKASPVWGPKSLSAWAELNSLELRSLEGVLKGGSYSGQVSGDVAVENFNLNQRGGLPPVEWSLEGRNVTLPPVTTQMFVMPAARVGPLKTQGRIQGQKLTVPILTFGNDGSTVEGNLKIELTLGNNGLPSNGSWSGRLRTSADFQSAFTDIDLDRAVGPAGADGFRQFSKNF